jgi:hypothetical protein
MNLFVNNISIRPKVCPRMPPSQTKEGATFLSSTSEHKNKMFVVCRPPRCRPSPIWRSRFSGAPQPPPLPPLTPSLTWASRPAPNTRRQSTSVWRWRRWSIGVANKIQRQRQQQQRSRVIVMRIQLFYRRSIRELPVWEGEREHEKVREGEGRAGARIERAKETKNHLVSSRLISGDGNICRRPAGSPSLPA